MLERGHRILQKKIRLHSKVILYFYYLFSSVQFSSVAQSCPTLCDPMNHSTPGLPVHPHLPEFIQTHAHQVSDAIQPSHPLSSPSPPVPNPSQHQSLYQWVNSSHEVVKGLEFPLQHCSFQRNPRADLLQNGLVGVCCISHWSKQVMSPRAGLQSGEINVASWWGGGISKYCGHSFLKK